MKLVKRETKVDESDPDGRHTRTMGEFHGGQRPDRPVDLGTWRASEHVGCSTVAQGLISIPHASNTGSENRYSLSVATGLARWPDDRGVAGIISVRKPAPGNIFIAYHAFVKQAAAAFPFFAQSHNSLLTQGIIQTRLTT